MELEDNVDVIKAIVTDSGLDKEKVITLLYDLGEELEWESLVKLGSLLNEE